MLKRLTLLAAATVTACTLAASSAFAATTIGSQCAFSTTTSGISTGSSLIANSSGVIFVDESAE